MVEEVNPVYFFTGKMISTFLPCTACILFLVSQPLYPLPIAQCSCGDRMVRFVSFCTGIPSTILKKAATLSFSALLWMWCVSVRVNWSFQCQFRAKSGINLGQVISVLPVLGTATPLLILKLRADIFEELSLLPSTIIPNAMKRVFWQLPGPGCLIPFMFGTAAPTFILNPVTNFWGLQLFLWMVYACHRWTDIIFFFFGLRYKCRGWEEMKREIHRITSRKNEVLYNIFYGSFPESSQILIMGPYLNTDLESIWSPSTLEC